GGVEEGALGRRAFQRSARDVVGLGPRGAAKVGIACAPDERESDPAELLELTPAQALEVVDGVRAEEALVDRRLHVGGLRLDGLLADLGKAAALVPHAAALPTHADRAGLACVVAGEAAGEADDATRFARLRESVAEGRETAGRAHLLRHQASSLADQIARRGQ